MNKWCFVNAIFMLYACYVCMLYVGPFIINHPKEEIVDILETHGDTAMPEQAI